MHSNMFVWTVLAFSDQMSEERRRTSLPLLELSSTNQMRIQLEEDFFIYGAPLSLARRPRPLLGFVRAHQITERHYSGREREQGRERGRGKGEKARESRRDKWAQKAPFGEKDATCTPPYRMNWTFSFNQ